MDIQIEEAQTQKMFELLNYLINFYRAAPIM